MNLGEICSAKLCLADEITPENSGDRYTALPTFDAGRISRDGNTRQIERVWI
jgi:hypothetical protein